MTFYPVAIQLYYDDFETANPIGSKAGVHKLGGFYFTIINLKRKFNCKLDNIHLLALADRLNIAKYGMSKILEPLQRELARLESGFDVILDNGETRNVVCLLGNVVADNLGLHGILGYVEIFSHSLCCDICLGKTDDFQLLFRESQYKLRDQKTYNKQVMELQANSSRCHVDGLKANCELSKLRYYHPANNDTCDIMHDILEGVAPYEVSLLLNHLIYYEKKLSLTELNRILNCYQYGPVMNCSKPSEILASKLQRSGLGQHSHQMLVLLYVLPLILVRYINEDDPHWKLFVLLLHEV
jgi:hypothetical protein